MEYQIGDFSKISRLSIKTLRYYHEIGLLSPTRVDSDSGYRFYDEKSLERVMMIEELKSFEFSLSAISEVLAQYQEDSDIVDLMKNKLEETNLRIAQYKEIRTRLNQFLQKEERTMMENKHEIVMKEVPGMLITSIRFKGKYSEVGVHISRLFKHCGRFAAGKPFSMYYDGEFKEEDADIEICVPVSKEVNKGDIKSRVLSGGKAVSIIHKGSYDSIGSSYKSIIDYVNKTGLNTVLPSREIYVKGPGMIFKGNANNYLTEIQIFTE